MQNNLWSDFPMTFFTHQKINHINFDRKNGVFFLYVNGKCILKIMEPNSNIRGIRASIGIYDDTITNTELEEYIKCRCGEVVKYAK